MTECLILVVNEMKHVNNNGSVLSMPILNTIEIVILGPNFVLHSLCSFNHTEFTILS